MSLQVVVHPFPSATPNSCAYQRGCANSPNALVYVPGLTGGPHTSLAFLDAVQQRLDGISEEELRFDVWEFRMRSSYTGFGISSIVNDVEDIAALVGYLKVCGKKRVVLMGSSSGCQACMAYMETNEYGLAAVNEYILQAPISDREAAGEMMEPDFFTRSLEHANNEIAQGHGDEIMPRELLPVLPIFNLPLTAYRWHSLIAKGGDDDYFSSDLDDATLLETFGRITKSTLILISENDEMVPPTVDKMALFRRWSEASAARGRSMVSNFSGLVPGADHALTDQVSQDEVAQRVLFFLWALVARPSHEPYVAGHV